LQPIFDSFTEFVYGICSPYTQDPVDIAYILATHWALYISPILNDWNDFNDRGEEYEIPPQAQARLNAIFRQAMGASVQTLYPRLVDSEAWLSQIPSEDRNIRFSRADRNTVLQGRKESSLTQGGDGDLNVTRIPLMGRYLLVASYLASFNPSRMDVRILSQVRDPTKKFRKIGARKVRPGVALKVGTTFILPSLNLTPFAHQIGHLLSGPGTFTFDRLWAISGALLEVFGPAERPPWASSLTAPGMFSEAEVTRVQFNAQVRCFSLLTECRPDQPPTD
jgi:origin recognition complex subunit 5